MVNHLDLDPNSKAMDIQETLNQARAVVSDNQGHMVTHQMDLKVTDQLDFNNVSDNLILETEADQEESMP